MDQALVFLTRNAATLINLIALLVIVFGTIEAFANVVRLALSRGSAHELRSAWLHYARWLVAGLTFQLAADILATAVAPGWDEVGKLAAIAAIRTALNYFLERDVAVGEVGVESRQARAA